MKLENSFTVPVPRADAWRVLMDVERIAPCMPGATLTSREGDSFTGTVKVKVGPINLTYGGQASFVSLDEKNGVAVISGSGKETRGTGTAKAQITCRLVETGGITKVDVETDLAVTGKPAQFGRGVLADVSAKLVDKFAACLSEEIKSGDPAAAGVPTNDAALAAPVGGGGGPAFSVGEGAGAAEAAAPAAQVAPASTAAPAGQAAAAHGAPVGQAAAAQAPAAPAGPAPAAPVAPRPVREAEPIDLLGTAGMPVFQRAAPVVAVLLAVLWLVRRLSR